MLIQHQHQAGLLPITLSEVMRYASGMSVPQVIASEPIQKVQQQEQQKPWKKHKHKPGDSDGDDNDKFKRKRAYYLSIQIHHTRTCTANQLVEIDGGASVHLIGNKELLSSIRPCNPIVVTGIGGQRIIAHIGHLSPIGDVYYCQGAPNLLSQSKLKPDWLVTYQQENETYTLKKRTDHSVTLTFATVNDAHGSTNYARKFPLTTAHCQAIHSTKVKRAKSVRYWHNLLGHPSKTVMCEMIRNKTIKNLPFTAIDVSMCESVIGACPSCLQGKAVTNKRNNPRNDDASKPGDI
jgi:hypothetical protein